MTAALGYFLSGFAVGVIAMGVFVFLTIIRT